MFPFNQSFFDQLKLNLFFRHKKGDKQTFVLLLPGQRHFSRNAFLISRYCEGIDQNGVREYGKEIVPDIFKTGAF